MQSFGTEDRPTDRPVAPREEIYEYIIFRGTDIKDIRVCQPPKPQPTLEGGLPNDPAIVQVLDFSKFKMAARLKNRILQHSVAPSMSSNAAVGSQKPIGSASSYGPIGSSSISQAGPGHPFPSSNVATQPQSKFRIEFFLQKMVKKVRNFCSV